MAKKLFSAIGFILLLACYFLIACNSTKTPQVGVQESKMEKIKIIEIPTGKMISSGSFNIMSDGAIMTRFSKVLEKYNKDIFPRDFLSYNPQTDKMIWYVSVNNLDAKTIDTNGFEIVDFKSGFYAVATAVDTDDNPASLGQTQQEIEEWVRQSSYFELDLVNRQRLTSMPAPQTKQIMGYAQLEVFVPIKVKE